ncbi:competence protein ComE [Anaerocolumna cellulosilytica]|uniref:Competence protein ComE n=1 Tax=Anaerocolumna cellulosilytica TaxID=433286 RepID=A0A6S6R8J1_9FIRM|nr:ComEC/Rec2 family competence protein [Anaerocolumna cellulosilytica]MBB5197047.1 competence protein ComEC [Anaerocolumna cellulosilytica]BCJ95261.1 competence protein ComE [Anaerocolumna cellulosilytica]
MVIKKFKLSFFIVCILSLIMFLAGGCSLLSDKSTQTTGGFTQGSMSVHFIDVGQADSILIQSGEETMLIDGGNNADGEAVVSYLKKQGVKELTYIIGTHPHEDHIGGLDEVINEFSVGKIFLTDFVLPNVSFERLLLAIREKDLQILNPVPGDEYSLGSGKFTFIAPVGKDYGNKVNNYSLGIKLENGTNVFLLTGDAEIESEKDMVESGIDLEADVMKLNHHGSTTSNSEAFIEAVDPIYAVITVGTDNPYGHPSSSIVTRLLDEDIQIYRTDLMGAVVITSDGTNLTFQTEKKAGEKSVRDETVVNETEEVTKPTAESSEEIKVYITETGHKYHNVDCSYLKKAPDEIDLMEALERGYEPCSRCNPPQ